MKWDFSGLFQDFLFVFGVSKIGVCIQNAFLQIAAFVSLFSRQKLLQAMWFSQNAFFLQEKEGDKAKLSNCTRVSFFPLFSLVKLAISHWKSIFYLPLHLKKVQKLNFRSGSRSGSVRISAPGDGDSDEENGN